MQAKLLTLCMALCALCLTATSQNVPDYVPTEGLVGWYPFNGNANDESGNGFNGDTHNTIATIDRNGFEDAALNFNGIEGDNGSTVVIDHLMLNIGQEEYTIHLWFRPANLSQISRALFNTIPHTGIAMTFNNNNSPSYVSYLLGPADAMWNYYYVHGPFNDYQTTDWYALTLTKQGADYKKYINGVLESAFSAPLSENYDHDVAFRISGISADWQIFDGDIDDVGFWNRALTEEEVLALYNTEPPISGCTDPSACNFDSEATSDNGSCIPPGCMDSEACNYNALAECGDEECVYSCCPGPGCCSAGMFWDSGLEQCLVIEDASNEEGIVGGDDLVYIPASAADFLRGQVVGNRVFMELDCTQLLDSVALLNAALSNTSEDIEPDLGSNEFTCGDSYNYHDYDYATVQIGEQCWFAENLRTELYENGDVISTEINLNDWINLSSGAQTSYSNDESLAQSHGLLYNWYAVMDSRKVCPSGWHEPSNGEWQDLESNLGLDISIIEMEGWRGNVGFQLKNSDTSAMPWNGSNEVSFNGTPSGYRQLSGGSNGFVGLGSRGEYWTTSTAVSDTSNKISRSLDTNQESLGMSPNAPNCGFSVRCLKDTEE